VVDAVNVTDNQTAIVRMSSLAACTLLKCAGLDPVLQVVVRDRNRIALQSDILGASSLGVRNVLCLSGDHQSFGNQLKPWGFLTWIPSSSCRWSEPCGTRERSWGERL
jgi:methylenetetrahydrofolate reductase (NADPH)